MSDLVGTIVVIALCWLAWPTIKQLGGIIEKLDRKLDKDLEGE